MTSCAPLAVTDASERPFGGDTVASWFIDGFARRFSALPSRLDSWFYQLIQWNAARLLSARRCLFAAAGQSPAGAGRDSAARQRASGSRRRDTPEPARSSRQR